MSVHCEELFNSIKGNLQNHLQEIKEKLRRDRNEDYTRLDSENVDTNDKKTKD